MAELLPFEALRYDPGAVEDLARAVAPPYDVISDAERDDLEVRSPYNVVRLILPRDEPGDDARSNKYTRARALLDAWKASGVLRRDAVPSLTAYEQRFSLGGDARVQQGILAAVRLDEPGEGGVLPHERTYDDIVDDRLALLRATETNLDPIFCVYDGGGVATDAVGAAPADAAAFRSPDGIDHRAWAVTDPGTIASVSRAVSSARIVIADGHHRWRTALRYRDERRATDGGGPWDAQMMLLVDASRFGPALLPIHRVLDGIDPDAAVRALDGPFHVREVPRSDPEELAAELAEARASARAFVMMDAKRAWRLEVADPAAVSAALPADRSPAWRDLDVAVLHAFAFEQLLRGPAPRFVHTATEAAELVDSGSASLAFLLAPMPFDAVLAVAEAGDAMPQKSTFFIPKPATGVALRPLG